MVVFCPEAFLWFFHVRITPARPAGCTVGGVDVQPCASSCLPPPPPSAHGSARLGSASHWWEPAGRERGSWVLRLVKFSPNSQLHKATAASDAGPPQYPARFLLAVFGLPAESGRTCGRCCRNLERVTYPEVSGNTPQRASVRGWLRTSSS